MKKVGIENVKDTVVNGFELEGNVTEVAPYGSGHINDTYLVTSEDNNGRTVSYILQRMNHEIFKNPRELMENVMKVTSFLRKKIIENGGNPDRETLNVVRTKNGDNYLVDEDGNFWRTYLFIEDAISFDVVEKPEDFYNSALSFGNFQRLLADYPAETLHETIVNFHNTVDRYAAFKKAVEEDVSGRLKEVPQEVKFVMDREQDTHVICDALEQKIIPLRVTHNDTKLNNIMMDKETGKGICVIDLDTVMPGSALYDYGDSIRFGANTGEEDEKNLDLISLDLGLFDIYTKGFLEGCGGSLTKEEVELFPMGAKLMTFECGIRFLTDYLQGDIYFKIHKPEHNLDRARTQFKLVADMEVKWEQMQESVRKYIS